MRDGQIVEVTGVVNFRNVTKMHFWATVWAYMTGKCAHTVVLKGPQEKAARSFITSFKGVKIYYGCLIFNKLFIGVDIRAEWPVA